VVGYWHGYLSGARCRLAYGPADAIATHWSLASAKSRFVLPFWYRLTWVVPEKGRVCVRVCVLGLGRGQVSTIVISGGGQMSSVRLLGPAVSHAFACHVIFRTSGPSKKTRCYFRRYRRTAKLLRRNKKRNQFPLLVFTLLSSLQ